MGICFGPSRRALLIGLISLAISGRASAQIVEIIDETGTGQINQALETPFDIAVDPSGHVIWSYPDSADS